MADDARRGPDPTMDQEELLDLLAQLDPVWSSKKVDVMTKAMPKDSNGRFNFEEFLQWCCSSAVDIDVSGFTRVAERQIPCLGEMRPVSRGDKVRVVKDRRTMRTGEEVKVVKVVGKLATVLEPNDGKRVKVELEEGDEGDRIESFSPFEVELVQNLEDQLRELRAALDEEQNRRQEAENRARLAEEALENLREQVNLDKQSEEGARKMCEEEARLKAEEEARLKAEEEARLKAEEEARLEAEEAEAKRLAEEAAAAGEPPGPSRTRLKVTVMRSQGLRAADIGGSSDPYCVVHIVGKHEDATHPPFKTDIQKKTLTPVWDQAHTFDACTINDELLFEVFDHDDNKKDDTLGSAILSPFEFRPDGFDGVLHLGEKKRRNLFGRGKKKEAHDGEEGPLLYVKVEVLQMAKIPDMPRCFVKLLSATNLRAADRGGKSDPYCICEVPGKPMSRFTTAVKKKTLSPEWKEESEINEYAKGDGLQVQVFDHDRGGSAGDPLGSVLLTSAQFDPDGFSGTLTLEGKGALANSTLTLLVDVF